MEISLFSKQVEDEWYDDCTAYVQYMYVTRFKFYWKYYILLTAILTFPLLFFNFFYLLCTKFEFFIPDVLFFWICVKQLTSQQKNLPQFFDVWCSNWNSGKYADVGCFAGKVDKGQTWFCSLSSAWGGFTNRRGGSRNFHPCRAPPSIYPRRNVTHLGIWVLKNNK